jgi:hypothetical protein
MRRSSQVLQAAVGCAVLATALSASPASAARVSVTDSHGNAPAQSDIHKATFAYTSNFVAAKVTIDDLDPSGIVALKIAEEGQGGPDARGIVTVKATKREGSKPKVRVSYWREIGVGMDCPDTQVDWSQPTDTVSFKVSMDCLKEYFSGAPKTHTWATASNLSGGGRDRTREVTVRKN